MAAAAAGLAVATDDGTIGKLKNDRYVKILKLAFTELSLTINSKLDFKYSFRSKEFCNNSNDIHSSTTTERPLTR